MSNAKLRINDPSTNAHTDRVKIIIVVEGNHDIEFLRRISVTLHTENQSLPDLGRMERLGHLIFIPFGGARLGDWVDRLAPLKIPEFHLYDHELPPETEHRFECAKLVNTRANCHAVVTRKRSLENYLHPSAILSVGKIDVAFDAFDNVPEMVSKQRYQRLDRETPWELLSHRSRRRFINHTKRWLNADVAEHMTNHCLHERDPDGEVISWLSTIDQLMSA